MDPEEGAEKNFGESVTYCTVPLEGRLPSKHLQKFEKKGWPSPPPPPSPNKKKSVHGKHSMDQTQVCDYLMKATELYCYDVFIMPYQMDLFLATSLRIKPITLMRHHSDVSYCAVLFYVLLFIML